MATEGWLGLIRSLMFSVIGLLLTVCMCVTAEAEGVSGRQ